MANLFRKFSTNKEMEQKGIWVGIDDARFLIARAGGGNVNFQRVLSEKLRPLKKQLEARSLSDEESGKIITEVYAETVVLDWQNVEDDDGPMECTRENIIRLFDGAPKVFTIIREESLEYTNYKDVLTDETVKN